MSVALGRHMEQGLLLQLELCASFSMNCLAILLRGTSRERTRMRPSKQAVAQ